MASPGDLLRTWHLVAAIASLFPGLAKAQGECDDLQILSLEYAPFTDTAMQVVINNPLSGFVGYPQFALLNADGDTIAWEQVSFFGLAPDTSTHRLDLLPGVALPASPFTGTLVFFYYNGDGPQVCNFPITDALCPSACTPNHVFLYAQFGSFVTSTFPWSMTDSLGAVVGAGELSIDSTGWGQDTDPLCLEPGAYTLHIAQPVAAGIEFLFGISPFELYFDGPTSTLPAGGSVDLPFQLFEPCVEGINGIAAEDEPNFTLLFDGERAILTDPRGQALGEVVLFDAIGRCVWRTNATTSSVTIDLTSVAAGVHLLALPNSGAVRQRIFVP